jgi:sensor domain CHASE-containing protein
VDHLGWGLDERETENLISSITDISNFDGVFIIRNNGETLLASKLE